MEQHKKITWTLFPRPQSIDTAELAWLADFFFSLLSFPPTAEPDPGLNWSLCRILFFLHGFAPMSFCTSKTLSTFPSPAWLMTFLLLIEINRRHARHVRSVKFLHVLFSYTRIYITFNSTSPASYFSFTISLCVCVHSSETAKGKYI